MSLYQYVTGTALVLLFISTGTVGTVGTLVPVTLCLCAYMLLVPHCYCSLYVLVLWVLLAHWHEPLYLSVPICYWYYTGTALYMYWYCGYCWYIGTSHSISLYQYVYWYCNGTALYMYWYCGYCWYIGTSHSMSLYQYVTGTALVLFFICTVTVGTVGTLVPATLSLYQYVTGITLVLLFISTDTVGTVGTMVPATLFLSTNMLLVLIFICTGTVGTVGTLVPATLCLCTNMLLVPHWYCSLYVLVLWVLLVNWY